jgi:hypothetical protein
MLTTPKRVLHVPARVGAHVVRVYSCRRDHDGLCRDTRYVTEFNGGNRTLKEEMDKTYPQGRDYIWLS